MLVAALGLGLAVAGCQEQLTAPGTCPATCPGGTPVLRDTVIDALVGADSTFTGYVVRGTTGGGMQVSNDFLGATRYGVVRFRQRQDSLEIRDTLRGYTIDSVVIELTILARDSNATGMTLSLFRLPRTVDSLVPYSEIDSTVTAGPALASAAVTDTARPFTYKFRFLADSLSLVDIPAADSGVFALAIALSGGTATGARIGGLASGTAKFPVMRTYATLIAPPADSLVKKQTFAVPGGLTTFVTSAPIATPDSTIHQLGGPDGNRVLLRFPWPAYLRDSALLARATLEMVPAQSFAGLPGDSAFVDLRGILVDFGAKSTVDFRIRGAEVLPFGSTDTVHVDLINLVQFWQLKTLPHPPALVVRMDPEGSSFTAPQFYSTREAVAARRPRLRITYQLPFDFERP
jgi:hypothetical protein